MLILRLIVRIQVLRFATHVEVQNHKNEVPEGHTYSGHKEGRRGNFLLRRWLLHEQRAALLFSHSAATVASWITEESIWATINIRNILIGVLLLEYSSSRCLPDNALCFFLLYHKFTVTCLVLIEISFTRWILLHFDYNYTISWIWTRYNYFTIRLRTCFQCHLVV